MNKLAPNLNINTARLIHRLEALAEIGALDGGGCCRLALSDEDRAGRDLVVGWMKELGLEVTVDRIGNVVGLRRGRNDDAPVMIGSHIDTVRTGGIYDGCLGVLAGLEVIETLNEAKIETKRPIAVAFFTNEEGARFTPDMMGSSVHQGSLALDEALSAEGFDGKSVAQELQRIGYQGDAATGNSKIDCFIELHIEQGPVLEAEGVTIGVVEGVQGISWTEFTIEGISNHAGTTPMRMRHDAGFVAMRIAVEARAIAEAMGGDQVATVGRMEIKPNVINVVPDYAIMTVDLRNTDEALLQQAEASLFDIADKVAQQEGVALQRRTLVRFKPVEFDPEMVDLVEATAKGQGLSYRRMPSGAGHDAQMFAPNCPTAMIFVPSRDGISHNTSEFSEPDDIRAGANLLLQVVLQKSGT